MKIRNAFKILAISSLCFAAFGAAAADAPKYTIGASLLTQQHPFYVELGEGMKKEAKAEGVGLDISIANQDLNKQISDVEDFISKKVNAIILSPVDSKGVKAAVLKAQQAGIPVITVDIAASGVDVAAHVATDNFTGGVKAGELMAKVLNGKGKVGVISYPTIQSVVDRVEGFKKALVAFPNIKIVSIQPGITRAEALATSQNMIQGNPDISGIFGFGDDAALAALAAAKGAGKVNQIKIIGFDGMKEAIAAVDKEDAFVGVIRQYPGKMGAMSIEAAVKILKGEKVEKNIPIVPGVYTRGSKE